MEVTEMRLYYQQSCRTHLFSLLQSIVLLHGFVGSSVTCTHAADYTPHQVLDHINASRNQISNATFQCLWKTFMEATKGPDGKMFGGTSQWEKQTFYWDNLGRRRSISQNGPLSKDGKMLEATMPCVEDTIFNGEIVANSKFYPKRTRTGEEAKSPEDATGYNAVIIGDAAAPLRSALESERNPLEYISNVALREINEAISHQSVIVTPTKGKIIVLEIKHTEPNSPYAKSLITIVPGQNWAIESVRSYRSDGGLAREIIYGYKEQADGLWVPAQGRHTHWGDRDPNTTPYFDWRFETTKAIYNDPSFNQHVFDIQLKPDTAVSDTRYKVAYRIGDEDAVATDLARYAADARNEAQKKRLPTPQGELSQVEFSWARKVVLVVTIILLISSICLFATRRIQRHAQ